MKILIIRFSSIGDIILTTHAIRNIRKAYPTASLHYCTKAANVHLIQNNPNINVIHQLNDSLMDLVHELKKEQFDVIIDLHNNLRTAIIKLLLFKKSYSFYKANFEKWMMVNFKINILPKQHIVHRYLKTVKAIGVKDDGLGLEYFIDSEKESEFLARNNFVNENYIVIAIGGQKNTKKLPIKKLAELIEKIDLPIKLIGGKEDKPIGDMLIKMYPYIESTCGQLSIMQSTILMKYAQVVITHDTGMMHIAAALQKEIISIWGNTIPAFGMTPYYGFVEPANIVFENNAIKCRPCSKIGYQKCPKKHFDCMNKIEFENLSVFLHNK